MLGGIDPIIIFQFSALAGTKFGDQIAKIPLLSKDPSFIAMPPIPIYLSRDLTGLYIDSESKNVDISTDIQTKTDASAPDINQKGIASAVTVNLFALKDSIGLSLLSAMIDQVFDKVTAKEYAITYMHGPIIIFRGVLRSFAMEQSADSELMSIKVELSKGDKQPEAKEDPLSLTKSTGARPL